MKKPRTIKFIATFQMLDWKSEIVEKTLVGDFLYEDFDAEVFMDAMNRGDMLAIPSPLKKYQFIFWKMIFPTNENTTLNLENVYKLETEPTMGAKFVVVENYKMVMEWRCAE